MYMRHFARIRIIATDTSDPPVVTTGAQWSLCWWWEKRDIACRKQNKTKHTHTHTK